MRILFAIAAIALLGYFGLNGVPMTNGATGGQSEVVMYIDSREDSSWEAERFFRSRGMAVRVHDVRANAAAHAEYIRLGGGTLPIILLEGDRLDGFRAWEAERLLDRRYRARPAN